MTDLNADFDAIENDLPPLIENVVQMPPEVVAEHAARMTALATLPPAAFAQWMRFKDQLAQGEEGRFIDVDALEAGLARGDYQFWPGRSAAMLTELRTFPNGERAVQVTYATGELAELLGMATGVEAWARLQGCTHALVEGRPGWKRPLKAAGYAPWSETLHKAL